MMSSVIMKAYFRPTRSPIRPKTIAPNGRTANPTANVASHFSSEIVEFDAG